MSMIRIARAAAAAPAGAAMAAMAVFALLGAAPANAQNSTDQVPPEWTLCNNEGNLYPPDIVIDGLSGEQRASLQDGARCEGASRSRG